MQPVMWASCGGLVLIALASGWADRRRNRRADLDRVSPIPWPLIQVLALLAAFVAASVALHLR